ncbi:uncharacterized protein LOC124712919 [Schistocerca piceifrons]|uniref:uncharacterized protein LOC124712919 n=1 Tax=Schistocerca piceifrons TaxID=274613 RepID=UPI001F5F5BF5|nr:uncharacterized protein LOC124712919 [Schistocerca piceifrons]
MGLRYSVPTVKLEFPAILQNLEEDFPLKEQEIHEASISLKNNNASSEKGDLKPFAGRIVSYTAVTADGRQWRMEDGEETEVLPRHLLRTYTDWEIHETFQRRGDDTNILTKADGTRVVSFPGGTLITTSIRENETEVFCEWSSEELDQYYEWYALRKDTRFLRRKLLPTGAIALLDEGYVYVRLRFCMEHPNYATVVASGRDLPLKLVMPQQTSVLVYPDGRFHVEAPDGVTLDVRCSSAVFAHSDRCESELDFDGYNFTDDTRNWSKTLCRTVDYTGKRFDVNYAGETACEADPNLEVPQLYKDYRCLIVNRNLSGRELIHEEEAAEWLTGALSRPEEAVVKHRLAFAPHLSYHLTMGPLGENESQLWLVQPQQAAISQEERRGVNRIPSTYGCPPSWFHPFPKRQEQKEEERELVSNPDVMQVRLLSEAAPEGARVVSAVAAALQQYLQRGADLVEEFSCVSDNLLPYCSSDELVRQLQKSATRQNVISRAHMRPRWQDKTSPAALELYHVVMARRGRLSAEELGESGRRWVDQSACLAVALSRIRSRGG